MFWVKLKTCFKMTKITLMMMMTLMKTIMKKTVMFLMNSYDSQVVVSTAEVVRTVVKNGIVMTMITVMATTMMMKTIRWS